MVVESHHKGHTRRFYRTVISFSWVGIILIVLSACLLRLWCAMRADQFADLVASLVVACPLFAVAAGALSRSTITDAAIINLVTICSEQFSLSAC